MWNGMFGMFFSSSLLTRQIDEFSELSEGKYIYIFPRLNFHF